ncbi:MAG TPA: hypothetical protein VLF43_01295 [Candidatus Saccharimonadales bacterium]|nr:hypothetical protein [Candidatus Saccharimonadales bacterium]
MNQTLTILPPTIKGTDLILQHQTPDGEVASRTFRFSRDLHEALAKYPSDRIAKLCTFIALGRAIYLFDEAYYTEIVSPMALTKDEVAFFEDFYYNGMAEFRLTNHIAITTRTCVTCPEPTPLAAYAAPVLSGALVTNGGGKDGATGAELLHEVVVDISWFTWNLLGSRPAIIAQSSIAQSLVATSVYDESAGKPLYSGHKPLNGPLAFLTAFAALVAGKRYAVVSNEYSASEPNMVFEGVEINHQYTKSFTVEQALHRIINGLDLGVYYFSILRPLYELQIMRILQDFPQYHHVFVSCNRGVKNGTWCLDCAKCAFITLCFTAINPQATEEIWGDRLVIAQPKLQGHIVALVAPHIDKPFECVGTLQECQLALGMIARNTALWQQLPADFRARLEPHIPANFDELYQSVMLSVDRPNNIPPDLRPAVYAAFKKHLGIS